MKAYKKTNSKKYMYRCIGGMISCISKLYNLNPMFRHYFALLMTITEFLNLLFGIACLSSSVHKILHKFFFKKNYFLLNQFVLKMLSHTCDIKMYYIVLQCSKMINDMSSWKQTILHFELIKCYQFFILRN